jgi:hypothetical protein
MIHPTRLKLRHYPLSTSELESPISVYNFPSEADFAALNLRLLFASAGYGLAGLVVWFSDVQHHCDMPPMKPRFRLIMLVLASCALAGCHTTQPPVTREVLVGSYAYWSKDPASRATDHEWDHLTLRADGKYDLVQGGPTKPQSENKGVWQFYGGDRPAVDLDHAGYPIEVKRNEVRLLIDLDVGTWWIKVK